MPATLPQSPLAAVSISDLARRWDISVTSVRRKVQAGLLPTIKLPGTNRLLIPADAVAEAERASIRTIDAPVSNFI